ncbi:hypothetical protein FQA39_LY14397 [Lamprigera yunnana]|nr:hypothetical protein FQA39_LY14397 [Lamprigera yunnana]
MSAPKDGNFSKCASLFNGNKAYDVVAFIDAIEVYKDCTNISNANALRGLLMLLDGQTLAHLPKDTLNEAIQLDMVYGLLNIRICAKMPQNQFKTFNEITRDQWKIILETFSVKSVQLKKRKHWNVNRERHDTTKSAESAESSKPRPAIKENPTTLKDASPSPSLTCFGLGTPGYIRSKCSKCTTVTPKSINFSVFSAAKSPDTISRRFRCARIWNRRYTGAKQSVARESLYRILERNKQRFVNDRALVKLADGSNSMRDILTTTVDVRMVDRVIQKKFIVLPYTQVQSTLLGIDFIQDAQIVLDAAKDFWHFSNDANRVFELKFEDSTDSITSL